MESRLSLEFCVLRINRRRGWLCWTPPCANKVLLKKSGGENERK